MQLSKEQLATVKAAQEAIDAVCDEFKVTLVPHMMIVQGKIVNHSVGILPEPEESRIIVPSVRKDVEEKVVADPKQNGGA